MRVEGIGELTDMGTHWLLVYGACGHRQAFARQGLEDPDLARREVLRHYGRCLICGMRGRSRSRPVGSTSVDSELQQPGPAG